MDAAVLHAMTKWPDVPACWGWLALDERGRWRLGQDNDGRRAEAVRHRGLADYLARNYTATADGAWFVQNGPQRVYVDLDAAPWVLHAAPDGTPVTHTGIVVNHFASMLLDEHGRLFAVTEHGLALVGADLMAAWLDGLYRTDHTPAQADDLDPHSAQVLCLELAAISLPIERVHASELPARFGFQTTPRATQRCEGIT